MLVVLDEIATPAIALCKWAEVIKNIRNHKLGIGHVHELVRSGGQTKSAVMTLRIQRTEASKVRF